ncbi:MAG: Rieske (2Fe-2S) protein [Candidatus Marinimicrobia bacterium]|jgi:Rieske Fe-S protein|nr:Rieske (2Fe-2S) protein [Candidatus Neomarinimicrobiota bacterium]
MGISSIIAYTLIVTKGILFISPRKNNSSYRKIYAGKVDHFRKDHFTKIRSLKGDEILIRAEDKKLAAFSSTCPHLGCKIKWEGRNNRFFCPCHSAVFDQKGNAVSGPPAKTNQNMKRVELIVDEKSEIVYLKEKIET